MTLSANGWPVLTETPPAQTIPGTDIRLSVRPGDVATVLLEVAARFHREVEPLDMPVREDPGHDDWGWAYRPVRGQSTGFSNHASGCAVDLNATLHPRGVRGTFTRRQEAAVRRILASTFDARTGRNVIRWGRDYSLAPEDPMHFEVNASSAAVSRVAERFRVKRVVPVKPKPAPVPVMEEDGMKADDELVLGPWSRDVFSDRDGTMTVGEAMVVMATALAQMNEREHAMAETFAGMAADIAALRKTSG